MTSSPSPPWAASRCCQPWRSTVPTFSVNEAAGSATITLRRIGSLAAGATAMVSTGGGTAIPGTDYTPLTNKAVTFAAGAATATFPIAIVNDTLAAANKAVGLQITGVGPGP